MDFKLTLVCNFYNKMILMMKEKYFLFTVLPNIHCALPCSTYFSGEYLNHSLFYRKLAIVIELSMHEFKCIHVLPVLCIVLV